MADGHGYCAGNEKRGVIVKFQAHVKLFLLAAVFLLSSVLISQGGWFARWRIDLTESGLFTLSQGTKNIVQKIKEPIHLRLYFSKQATEDMLVLRTFHRRVVDLLRELERYGKGKLKISFIDVMAFSEQEDEASQYGLQALPVGEGGEPLFFGIAGSNSIDGIEVLPFLYPRREPFLEYDLARMIYRLNQSKKPVIGVLTDLPLLPESDSKVEQIQEGQIIFRQLQKHYELIKPGREQPDLQSLDLLILAQPQKMPSTTLSAINQFVMNGGRLLVFVDPFVYVQQLEKKSQAATTQAQPEQASGLSELFATWGVEFNPQQAILDRQTAITIQSPQGEQIKHLAFNAWSQQNFNQQGIMVDGLSKINTAISGHFVADANRLQPILSSSKQSSLATADAMSMLYNPAQLLEQFDNRESGNYTIAGKLKGPINSVFTENNNGEQQLVKQSIAEPQVLLFADVDWLFDQMWIREQNAFGRTVYSHFADNNRLLMNLIDFMTDSPDLIKTRNRSSVLRSFDKVREIRQQSEQKYRQKESRLLQRLRNTETKLNQLQQHKEQENRLILSDEQQQEINKFKQEKLNVRKQLREVKRNLNRDIEALGNQLKFINIVLFPMLVSLLMIILAWTKSKRR